jgi:hypothetical protein
MADPEQAYHGDRATNPDSLAIKVARKVTVTVVYEYEGGQKVEQKLRVRPETFLVSQYCPVVKVPGTQELVSAEDSSFVMHGMALVG